MWEWICIKVIHQGPINDIGSCTVNNTLHDETWHLDCAGCVGTKAGMYFAYSIFEEHELPSGQQNFHRHCTQGQADAILARMHDVQSIALCVLHVTLLVADR